MFLKKERIGSHINVAMREVDDGRVVLEDDSAIEFKYAMIVPPFVGQPVIRAATEIADEKGYVKSTGAGYIDGMGNPLYRDYYHRGTRTG